MDKPVTNLFERALLTIAPGWAAARARQRMAFAYYEAATPDRTRKGRRERGSGDAAVLKAGTSLREQVRHLEQNHDLARGALNTLVANTIGPAGIQAEPQPRRADGSIHAEFAREILRVWRDWQKHPEVTFQHDWPSAQRLAARTWYRDGETFAQLVEGTGVKLDHGTLIPLSLELMEPDFVPLDYNDTRENIVMGVKRNTWNRPTAYFVYRQHPGGTLSLPTRTDLKLIAASRMLHPKLIDRIGQTRGVSVFASVLTRLEDLKDYEESERIAAKVAASMAAMIIKGVPEEYQPDPDATPRSLKFRPGMFFDDLRPGERVETIDTKRPNANLEPYRNGQLRAGSAGIGITFSSFSKNYDGTYSAQRQELVEGYGVYGMLSAEFTAQFVRPVYERAIALAVLSGVLVVPADVLPETVDDALYIGPQMPWIDPLKEANAWVVLEGAGYASGPEIIRRRGQNPADVLEQEAHWIAEQGKRGLRFTTQPAESAPEQTDDDVEQGSRARTARRRA